MFQLKFRLKTFETCSLLYVSVLKCRILAIFCLSICYYIQVPRRGPNWQRGKNFQGCTGPLLLTYRAYGLPFGRNIYTTML